MRILLEKFHVVLVQMVFALRNGVLRITGFIGLDREIEGGELELPSDAHGIRYLLVHSALPIRPCAEALSLMCGGTDLGRICAVNSTPPRNIAQRMFFVASQELSQQAELAVSASNC